MKKIDTQARAMELKAQVRYYRSQGMSAKDARSMAGETLRLMLANDKARAGIIRQQAKAEKDLTSDKVYGNKTKSPIHLKSRAKSQSNSSVASTWGKGRNVVRFDGQKTEENCLTIVRKRDTKVAHARLVKNQAAAKTVRKQRAKGE